MPSIKPATLAIRVECTGNVTEEALAQLEAALEQHTEAVDLRFARACLLEELGRLTRARGAYKGVLARDATHFGALMNLGTMLYLENRRPEARILYQHATKHHPSEPSGFVNLGNVLAEDDAAASRAAYERALELAPTHATANFGLALLLEAQGDRDGAREYRERAFAEPIVRIAPYHGVGEPLRLLMLLAANGGNIVTTLLLDDTVVETASLVADSYHDGMTLPPHDLIFNAIGDADRSDDSLAIAGRIAAASSAPLINRPAAVLQTRRDLVDRLNAVPGVTAPQTELFPRPEITAAALTARGYTFPLLLRSPGYHMGEHFALVQAPADLARVVATLPGFARVEAINDAVTACIGACGLGNGGLVIAGTGSAGIARVGGKTTIIGGRGFLIGDDGSGARIGADAMRAALRACDGVEPMSELSRSLLTPFGFDPVRIVRWAATAKPNDYGVFAPQVFAAADSGDAYARAIIESAAAAIAALARALFALGAPSIALVGGVAEHLRAYLPTDVEARLHKPRRDAVDGAILLVGGVLPDSGDAAGDPK